MTVQHSSLIAHPTLVATNTGYLPVEPHTSANGASGVKSYEKSSSAAIASRGLPNSVFLSPQATIIVPAYNEVEALPYVLQDLFAALDDSYEVIVVDDGSKDGTSDIALQFPCRVIVHSINQGKGAAMLTGIRHAQSDKIIFIDGDATYPATAIPGVVEQLDSFDLVRCVRSQGRDNIPLINRLGNQIFDSLISLVHRVEGGDVLSGLYGLRRHHLLAMRLDSKGFDIETEIMVKATAMDLSTHNIPIQYNERIGEKKLNPVKDGFKILGRILSLALMFNPFATYVMPGLTLWGIGIATLLLLLGGPIYTPIANFSIHTLIVSVMAFLAGFQLVVFGCVVNLYAAEAGLSKPNMMLKRIASRTPRLGGVVLGSLFIVVGLVWNVSLALSWVVAGMGLFVATESLVIALALVVWGIQLLSTMLFLSLFAGSRRYNTLSSAEASAAQSMSSIEVTRLMPDDYPLERAVGER